MAELKDILKSGDINTIKLADNIIFDKANIPEAVGMFMKITDGGVIQLHRFVDQDVTLESVVSTDIIPPEAWTEYYSITTTHELTPENGSMTFYADAFVLDNKDRSLWLRAKVDGVVTGPEEEHQLWKDSGQDHQAIVMSRGINTTIPVGSVVTLELYGESDGIQINGAYANSKFKLTAAQAAVVAINDGADGDTLVLKNGEPTWVKKHLYEFTKVKDFSTTDNTYQVVAAMLIPDAPSGLYEYKISATYNYNKTTRSVYFRFSTDNGVSWNEIRREPKDNTDNVPFYYAYPKTHGGGAMYLALEARCENSGDVLNVDFCDVIIERKG